MTHYKVTFAEKKGHTIVNAEEKTVVTRPAWSNAIRGRRAEVWFRRAVSAYDLAARLDTDVTEEARDTAAKLLDSIQRYALADAREWERENNSESYCNSRYHKARQKTLDRRRERLEKQLAKYGCKLVNYGLYPTVIDAETGVDLYALHYFDY